MSKLSWICIAVRCLVAETAGITFLAFGDWGGSNDTNPTKEAQIQNAAGASLTAEQLDAKGVLLLGDNFYDHGVSCTTSPRFDETFENVYKKQNFKDLPFYVIAGNHDHEGNVQAQVDYRDTGGRWHFPKLYYKLPFSYTSSAGMARSVDLLMIDTVGLAGPSDDLCRGCDLPGPSNADNAETQWAWIQQQLSSSSADHIWVAGHYPIYSAGDDGTTQELVRRLHPLLKQYGAHYISGHDHMPEHIFHDDVHMFVSGMGIECCYTASKKQTVPIGAIQFMLSGDGGRGEVVGPRPASDVSAGFATLTFDDVVNVSFHGQDGKLLYAAPSIASRRQELVV